MVLKVFHVVRQYHPSIGGLEDVVFNIAQQQLKTGQQEPTVITLDRLFKGDQSCLPHHEVRDGVKVIRLPYWGSNRYPICFKVLSAIRDADVVHVHGVDFFFDFLALTRPWHRKPLVACSHGIFFHTDYASGLKKVFFNTVTRLSCLAYRRIFATSSNDGCLFSQVCNAAKIEVIENGVNIDKFRLPPRTDACKSIIYFGRWASNKGLMETLSLFKQLLIIDAEWRLIIAGREYDLTEQHLSSEAKHLGIADNVRIVPNPAQETLKSLLQQAGYFICLSRHEGFGLAAIEAMSAGLIPLLSSIPPFCRLVNETKQGLILSESVDAASQQIIDLHEKTIIDYPSHAQMQENSIQHYSWNAVAVNYIRAYADISSLDNKAEASA